MAYRAVFRSYRVSAAGYNALSVITSTRGLPDSTYIVAANVSYLLVTARAIYWLLYSYADKHGSLAATSNFVVRATVAVIGLGAILTATGWFFDSKVGSVSDGGRR